MDFPINLQSSGKLPLRQQLGSELRRAIRSRRVRSGDTLPSSRHMADLLGISRDTVVRAYQDLLASGYLETRTGAKTVVRKNASKIDAELPSEAPATFSAAPTTTAPLSRFAQRLAASAPANNAPVHQLPLEFVAPPTDLLPAKQWRAILSRHCPPKVEADEAGALGYRKLREVIASYLKRSKAINCHADQVMIFPSTQMAVDLITRILIDSGDIVAVENPGNCQTRETLLARGAQVQPISVNSHGMVIEELAKAAETCKLVCVTPAHHNPTGAVMSVQRRGELLQWAQQRNAYIIEDATDSDYRYGGQPIPAIQGLDDSESVIYLYSFEKTLFPLVNTACIVLPPHLVDVFAKAHPTNYPSVDQYVLADFIAEGHLERLIWRTRSIYARRRRTLIIELYKKFSESVTVAKENSGLHLMARFNMGIPGDHLEACARQAGLQIVSTAITYMKNAQSGEFLISFAAMTEDQITSSVDRFAKLATPGFVSYPVFTAAPHI